MELTNDVSRARKCIAQARKPGVRIGFVPTMGALHDGHMSLVREARRETGFVVVSIFVNPTQFGPSEDLQSYPRSLDHDLKSCKKEDVDLIFVPTAEQMYQATHSTYVVQEGVSEPLCGASRPGHFHGVCTVVAKLFNIVQPDVAYFGRKDYQQTVVIRRMVADLNFPVEIRVMPTVREPDGLAMSSRNRRLSASERSAALCLYRALQRADALVRAGRTSAALLRAEMSKVIAATPGARAEYVAVVDPDTLQNVDEVRSGVVAALAVRVGSVRLIDNAILIPDRADEPLI